MKSTEKTTIYTTGVFISNIKKNNKLEKNKKLDMT